jgi:hypothetical protein
MRLVPLFTLLGWVLIMVVFLIGLLVMAPTAASHFGNYAKEARDTAVAGSALLGQLTTLMTLGRWLEPLAFLGVASFMVGIASAFSSIPALLKNRGQVMSACFPYISEQ